MNTVEFYSDGDGKVEYSIFDGDVFSEEDYDSLEEQGEFGEDAKDKSERAYSLIHNILNGITPQRKPPNPPKNRKGRRKIANLSRKINRSK